MPTQHRTNLIQCDFLSNGTGIWVAGLLPKMFRMRNRGPVKLTTALIRTQPGTDLIFCQRDRNYRGDGGGQIWKSGRLTTRV